MRGNFIFPLVKFDQSGLSEEFVKILILDIQGYPQRIRLQDDCTKFSCIHDSQQLKLYCFFAKLLN